MEQFELGAARQRQKVLHFPSVQMVLRDNASCMLDCYAKRAAHLQSQLQRRMIRRARLMETDVTKLLGLFNSDTEEDDFMGFSQDDESDL
ncbi:hypothetical protein D4764_14G0000900 [Takifugu flavidus]|uniref:Uncharacterized protein n=1 Tax=Takifugu flavidus TaxID=433684 RepID=A0A5C6P569_9TELE|nr:hypothetical protein D4764_14G0000900 [Takifugu flavidus]